MDILRSNLLPHHIRTKLVNIVLYLTNKYRGISAKLGYLKVTDGVYGLFDYKGLKYSSLVHDPELLRICEEFDDFRDDDVVVLTYPKSGTHFLVDVINSIYLEKGLYTEEKDHFENMLTLEIVPPGRTPEMVVKRLREGKSPRVIGTHQAWNHLPPKVKSHQVKVIHCLRNPKDVACSAYPFVRRLGVFSEDTTWETFLEFFTTNRGMLLDFFEFMRQWYPNRNSPNNFHIYYEDMIEDLDRETRRIADFLGIKLTDEQVARIAEANQFSAIKKKVGDSVMHRQGKRGTWTSKFTVEQNEAVDRWIERGMAGLDDIKFKYD